MVQPIHWKAQAARCLVECLVLAGRNVTIEAEGDVRVYKQMAERPPEAAVIKPGRICYPHFMH